jgi:putative peptidoglycan lipid II flippase
VLLPPDRVVLGLAAANGLSFVVGVLIGQWLLFRRLGHVRTREVLVTLGKTLVASVVGAAAAWGVGRGLDAAWLADWPAVGRAWTLLVIGTLVALPVTLLGMRLLRVNELDAVFRRFARR